MLHNRELEFYEWMEKCKREDNDYPHDFSHLLTFYGGSECGKGPGILILNDLSSRIGIQPSYSTGYNPEMVFQIVKAIAGYQSVYLCTDNEVSVGKELIKFDLPVLHSRPKLDKNNWMTKEEKEYLKEWTQPKELFAIHTQIPEGVKGF
ncbi:hypothetical protein PMAYCL1PPCAC_30635 [Pristionchus mayeri]|uniref:Uncharacterized protein n=1 Tax=Pristionchus mayeri TaxID=1317129 RepID=A0AAN5DD20_9BILA|nr:hypothetical protein PMAYCL1PPCAC_30635 [Pristionchus mayeri]